MTLHEAYALVSDHRRRVFEKFMRISGSFVSATNNGKVAAKEKAVYETHEPTMIIMDINTMSELRREDAEQRSSDFEFVSMTEIKLFGIPVYVVRSDKPLFKVG
jgi:hypothetical protein